MTDKTGIFATKKPFVIVNLNLFTPKAFLKAGKPQGEPKFSLNILIPKDSDELPRLSATAKAVVAEAKQGDFREEVTPFAQIKKPWRDGDAYATKKAAEGKNYEYCRGHYIVNARSKFDVQLAVLDPVIKGTIDLTDEQLKLKYKSWFYNGVKAWTEFNLVPYIMDEKPGLTAYLQSTLSTNKGARIAGGKTASDTFSEYVGAWVDEDPTGEASAPEDEF